MSSMAIGDRPKRGVPEGLWLKCSSCKEILYRKDVVKNLHRSEERRVGKEC